MDESLLHLTEKTLSSEYLYEGRIVTLRKDIVQLSNNTQSTREIVEHDPAVVVLPIDVNNQIYLIKQYRKAVNDILIEVPAGLINHSEDHLNAAKRELREETGFEAGQMTFVGSSYPSPEIGRAHV